MQDDTFSKDKAVLSILLFPTPSIFSVTECNKYITVTWKGNNETVYLCSSTSKLCRRVGVAEERRELYQTSATKSSAFLTSSLREAGGNCVFPGAGRF